MAKLSSSERRALPDRAFAYVDSKGRRSLPINDEAHVRNALARFDRVAFEDDAAEERARRRLLNAAKKYGIVPVGFVTGQVRKVRTRSNPLNGLPTGMVTFLMTDIEDSTALVEGLGDEYAGVREALQGIVRRAVLASGGREVDARADEFFAVFEAAPPAVDAAVAIQRELATWRWGDDLECRVRIGIHSGRPTLTTTGYVGLSVNVTARLSASANGGQILVSGETASKLDGALPAGVRLRDLGSFRLRGLSRPQTLLQVEAEGIEATFGPPRTLMP
jgi:class 3 adenylate cyclase